MTKTGFLGPVGTFSYLALQKYSAHDGVPKDSFFELFDALKSGEVDQIIVPIENSLAGSVSTAIDLAIDFDDIFVAGEVVLPISHSLMTKKGLKKEAITDIISHPMAINQCADYLKIHYRKVQLHQVASTAQAASMMEKFENSAIIGHKSLAMLHDLEVLDEEINDQENNTTRFFIISKNDPKVTPTGHDKTTIIFGSHKDQPGSLYEALGEFAKREINLTKIESRPTKAELGDYLFWIELSRHVSDPKMAEALTHLQGKASYFKCLGSYGARIV